MNIDEEVCTECDGVRLKRVPCLACDLPMSLFRVHIRDGGNQEMPCVCEDRGQRDAATGELL